MSAFFFFADTYDTERLKTLSVWSRIPDEHMRFRLEPRARSPLEHMVHQCLSEDGWMRTMLGIDAGQPALPVVETRTGFLQHYASASAARLDVLRQKPDEWFLEPTTFFDVTRSRAWVLLRRLTHSAHHRGQLTAYIRMWGQPLFSTYGPTADTGGLAKDGATVVYRYDSIEDLLAHDGRDGDRVPSRGRPHAADRAAMNVLVTGGTGILGREVVRAAHAAGHRVVTMSRKAAPNAVVAPRWATAHLVTGEGLAAAVADVDVVIHAASDPRGDPAADEEGTRRLASAARAAGVGHLVYVSIVGIDRIPLPYYARKLAAERSLAASGQPYSILRATQFHFFVDVLLGKAASAAPLVMPLPAGFQLQSVDIEDVAARLLRAIDEGPQGRLPDYGGPARMTAREAARLWRQARGVRKPIVPLPAFNATARAFRAGHNTLPADTSAENRGRVSWEEWLARPAAPHPY